MLRRAAHVYVVAPLDLRVHQSVVVVLGAEGDFFAFFSVVLVFALISAIIDVLYSNLLIVSCIYKNNAFVLANFLIFLFLAPLVEAYFLEVTLLVVLEASLIVEGWAALKMAFVGFKVITDISHDSNFIDFCPEPPGVFLILAEILSELLLPGSGLRHLLLNRRVMNWHICGFSDFGMDHWRYILFLRCRLRSLVLAWLRIHKKYIIKFKYLSLLKIVTYILFVRRYF